MNERNTRVEQVNGREQRWEDLIEKVERVGIEPGIEELVVGLNLFGYQTMFSCEGHQAFKPLLKEDSKIYAKWRPVSVVFRFKTDSDEVRQVESLIDEFYQNRQEVSDSRLCISSYTKGFAELTTEEFNKTEISQDQQDIADSISASHLLSQQQELGDFGKFLKNKYINPAD